jgi:hypothetical protein
MIVFLAWNNVSAEVTRADEIYIKKIIAERNIREPTTFEQQISTILAVQDAVLDASPGNDAIPLDEPREPKDLYQAQSGECYDRSRTIEKALEYLHMKVRHVAVYSTAQEPVIYAILSDNTPSHALSEVLTKKGWMAVSSLSRWIGLTSAGDPVNVADLAKPHVWSAKVPGRMSWIFKSPFISIIGLYSRHGQFYPPYLPIPDVNYRQLLYNL